MPNRANPVRTTDRNRTDSTAVTLLFRPIPFLAVPLKYGGHEEQQARQDMENCPIMPYLVIAFIVGHMQFDSGVCGQDKHGNQAPVYYKNLFHLSFGFNRCGKVRIFDWNRTITNVKK